MSREDPFTGLTWDDLESWAGTRVVSRGRKLQETDGVVSLWRFGKRELLARVQGGSLYHTRISYSKEELTSICTCPYRQNCKHAAAAVFQYLENIRESRPVPKLDECHWDILHAFLDIDLGEIEDVDILREHLKTKSKNELISLFIELADSVSVVREMLLDKKAVEESEPKELMKSVRAVIDTMGELEWDRYGYGTSGTDFERMKERLRALLKMGAYDDLVSLGSDLLYGGNETVQYEEESESADDIRQCLDILFEALPHTSLSPVDKILWAIDLKLDDDYCLCNTIDQQYTKSLGSKRDWSEVADKLMPRLNQQSKTDPAEPFDHRGYSRKQLSDWIARALEFSGREAEICDLYIEEARTAGNWGRLVDYLVSQEKWIEAKAYCIEGIQSLKGESGIYGNELYDKLEEIYQNNGDMEALAASLADAFFSVPSAGRFANLVKAARNLKIEKPVVGLARYFLETGVEPWDRCTDEVEETWPLPLPEALSRDRSCRDKGPHYCVLVEIAMKERKPDEVLKWYDAGTQQKGPQLFSLVDSGGRVAEAIKNKFPERAIQIWQKIAKQQIDLVNVHGYEAAAPFIRKIRKLMLKLGMDRDWEEYLSRLKSENRRRPRCMEILHRIGYGDRKIVD